MRGDVLMGRKMKAYGERESHGHYILDDYTFSRNHTKAITIRRWRRTLKKKGRIAWKQTIRQFV